MHIDLEQIISSFCRGLFRESVQKSCKKQTISGFMSVWRLVLNPKLLEASNLKCASSKRAPILAYELNAFWVKTFETSNFYGAVAVVKDANPRVWNILDSLKWPTPFTAVWPVRIFFCCQKKNRGKNFGKLLKIFTEFYKSFPDLGQVIWFAVIGNVLAFSSLALDGWFFWQDWVLSCFRWGMIFQ